MKRFWTEADVDAAEGGWQVRLDGRPVRTPARRACTVPSRALAEAMAEEWRGQGEEVQPLQMPLTRAVSTALDRVGPEREAVAQTVAAYGETDLLCYRAPFPPELVERQNAAWDPWLKWAVDSFGARLVTGVGVTPVAQPPDAVAALSQAVIGETSWRLTGLAELVTLSGSLVLGLAVFRGVLPVEQGWRLSRIDEDWNVETWGEDSEAMDLARRRERDFMAARRYLTLLEA